MVEYNSYPKDIRKIDFYSPEENMDFFTYCWESEESRQAYIKDTITEVHEKLKIIWIKKSLNLGYAFGLKHDRINYYKIGTPKNWESFKTSFASQFYGDNS